jgi:hypothetical protein
MPNQITGPIPASVLAQAQDHLEQARQVLAPYLHPLTPDERQGILKMGDKSVGFMQKLLEYASHSPSFVPGFVSYDELKHDVGVVADLNPLEQAAAQLALDLNSTVMLAGSEGMSQASPVYQNIKFMAQQRQPGALAAYEDLSQRYPGRRPKGGPKKD